MQMATYKHFGHFLIIWLIIACIGSQQYVFGRTKECRYESVYVAVCGMRHFISINEWRWCVSRKRKQKSKLTVWQFHTRYNRIGLCAIYLAMLLMLCGDVELNPGPVKFPCGVCNKAVRNGVRAVCCDMCDKWFHIKCTSMSNALMQCTKY